MNTYTTVANDATFEKTKTALEQNGFAVMIAENANDAKEKALELIPEKSEVMTMTSVTLDTTGIASELNDSGKYDSVKTKLMHMNRDTESSQMQKLGAAPEYAIGSVHAVTEDGKVLIASNSGSQLPGYAYGSSHVVWVVGGQKIVKDLETGLGRIYDHVLPLESERAHKAYGVEGSFVSKLLIFNRERPGRISIILVKEKLGY